MNILLILSALLSVVIQAQEYELLAQQDTSQCMFANGFDQGVPTDDCYSNIGTVSAKKEEYRNENGDFVFRLKYYGNSADVELVWTQQSWIEESSVVGADLSQIPTQTAYPFRGLALSSSPGYAYLDGSDGSWMNAVVSFAKWNGGIPANNGQMSIGFTLEILAPAAAEITTSIHIESGDITSSIAPAVECGFDAGQICVEIEANTARIDAEEGSIDDVNARIDSEVSALNARIDGLSIDGAHSFVGDVIGGKTSTNTFDFTKTELLLVFMNVFISLAGLCICWRGGLFSSANDRKYRKVSQYYESEDVEKPMNA